MINCLADYIVQAYGTCNSDMNCFHSMLDYNVCVHMYFGFFLCPFGQIKYKLNEKTFARMTFLLAPPPPPKKSYFLY